MKIGLILLAAGEGRRFGGSKLENKINNKPIIEYILSNIPKECFSEMVIVAANKNILETAEKYGISGIINDKPELSISHSIIMGTKCVKDADAYMYVVSDQPLLSKKTIRKMIETYKKDTILALAHNNKRGNPVIFPSYLYEELTNLEHGQSGQKVINAHLDILEHLETDDEAELMDIDTKDNFLQIEKIIASRDG